MSANVYQKPVPIQDVADEISLALVSARLRGGWHIILLCMVFGTVLALAVARIQPLTYSAEMTVGPADQDGRQGSSGRTGGALAFLTGESGVPQEMNNLIQTLKSARLGKNLSYDPAGMDKIFSPAWHKDEGGHWQRARPKGMVGRAHAWFLKQFGITIDDRPSV